MLWLARFDSTGGQPDAEPVDLGSWPLRRPTDRGGGGGSPPEADRQCRGRDRRLDRHRTAEWLDRLLGVLLDNACKYSPDGGSISVSVAGDGRRVRLTVDDSGPGISAEERGRVFDRFHRATDVPGGAGLGLAIADAIVHASGGRWTIGTSSAGGASVSVSWSRSFSGRREPQARQAVIRSKAWPGEASAMNGTRRPRSTSDDHAHCCCRHYLGRCARLEPAPEFDASEECRSRRSCARNRCRSPSFACAPDAPTRLRPCW